MSSGGFRVTYRNTAPRAATVVGAGAWGTAVAHLLSYNFETVYLWAARTAVVEEIEATRRNQTYLPDIDLRPNVIACSQLDGGLLDSALFVWAIPIEYLRSRLRTFAPHLRNDIILVNLGKGIEERTGAMPADIVSEECGPLRASGSMVGPNIASEVASGMYAEAVLGLSDADALGPVAAYFSTNTFRIQTTTDVRGIEIGAALKNMCSIAAGLCDGLGLGANTKSLVVARSIEEIDNLSVALGAKRGTLASSCLLADVVTSCYSVGGRNRRVGEYLGRGLSLDQARSLLGGRVAEGVATCRACYELQARLGLTFSIVENLHALLNEELSPNDCVQQILRGHSSFLHTAIMGKATPESTGTVSRSTVS